MRLTPVASAFALAVLSAAPAQAQPRLVLHERLVGVVNPMGGEHMLAAGARLELGDGSDLLTQGTYAEIAAVNYLSPIYSMSGGYVEVSPLAFLVLRAQLTSVDVWSIGMPGAGYYGSDNGAVPSLAPDAGGEAHGFSALGAATLQMAFPIDDARLILWDELSVEHLGLGDAPYHFSARHDAVLARHDQIFGSHAMALLEIPLPDRWSLRLGAYDELRVIPRSGWLSNQVGGMVMLAGDRPLDVIGSITPFVRVGAYTHHERRAGEVAVLLGAMIRWEPLR